MLEERVPVQGVGMCSIEYGPTPSIVPAGKGVPGKDHGSSISQGVLEGTIVGWPLLFYG